ncbi:dihydrofolate reductase family protein [Flammeovirga sp. EKP202]|uniref:dihydrofolate reductase family protein n=1 Tax=Flammeovirga sp. EKP202 TaxID=2770592 RepID=UPI0016600311|nr:dihydrofolate reductase family protein [Flammeovirga sp. EKP202]MBD0403328.1 dihydrofolate reductase [Flammeovirga sp. EKP202]
MNNKVYIATSIDGFIADKNEGLDWLQTVPNPNNDDMGFSSFMDSIDALVMGRNTYEMVKSFGGEWPYSKPVFVLSTSIKEIPEHLNERVYIINGTLNEVLEKLYAQNYLNLYIDGGSVIQSFLKEDLIDDLIISTIPVVLGGGFPLFGETDKLLEFELVSSKVLLGQIVQTHYSRKK